MEKEVKIKTVGRYNGHSIKANKVVDLSLKLPYDEMINYIQSVQMLNENITLKVKISDAKPMVIGTFMIGKLEIDHDGEGILKLKSTMDSVNADDINKMVVPDPFKIMLEARIEVEEEDPDDEEPDWDAEE